MKKALAYIGGVALIVLGAAIGKFWDAKEAALALIGAGAWWLGKLRRRPRFMKPKPSPMFPTDLPALPVDREASTPVGKDT